MKKFIKSFTSAAVCLTLAVSTAGCANPSAGDPVDAASPVIFTQPEDLTLRKGEETRGLEVTAYASDNGSLSYQWYGNTTDSNSGGTAISGSDKSILTVDTATAGTSYYYCVVTNTNIFADGARTATVTSETATVRITYSAELPRIIEQPASAAYVIGAQDEGLPLTVDAAVAAGELSYQWFVSEEGSYEVSSEITGATQSSYTPDVSARGVKYYYCEVTNTDEAATDGRSATVKTKIAGISTDYDFSAFTFEETGENTCRLTAYTGSSLRPFIPLTDSDGRAVTEIGKGVFANLPITEVTLPDTVESLGWDAATDKDVDGVFYNCASLRIIHFNGHLKLVGAFAFSKCSALETDVWAFCDKIEALTVGAFQNVALPENMVFPSTLGGQIGSWMFQNATGVKNITFEENGNVTSIGGSAFANIATLETVVFPASLTSVGDCLKGCSSLKSVTYTRSRLTDGEITAGVPFSGTYSDDFVINVPFDSYDNYVSVLGSFGSYVVEPPPATYTLTVEGATIDGKRSIDMLFGATLDENATIVYDDEEACFGWVYGDAYYTNYAEFAKSFKMGYGDTTVKAVYEKDFTQIFTPSCRTEKMSGGQKTTQEHVQVGNITATRIKYSDKSDVKVLNGSNEEHGTADGVYNACPVNPQYKTCLLMTFTNNTDEAIEIRYEVEYWGVIGQVTVSLGANETKTAFLVATCASNKDLNNAPFHQLRIVSGGENGYDLTIYGMRAA